MQRGAGQTPHLPVEMKARLTVVRGGGCEPGVFGVSPLQGQREPCLK